MKTGVELIADERTRQIEQEGWSQERDVIVHENNELAEAAVCYAAPDYIRCDVFPWPWSAEWWKPTPEDRVRELVKAGALIAAEIDRLQAIKAGGE